MTAHAEKMQLADALSELAAAVRADDWSVAKRLVQDVGDLVDNLVALAEAGDGDDWKADDLAANPQGTPLVDLDWGDDEDEIGGAL